MTSEEPILNIKGSKENNHTNPFEVGLLEIDWVDAPIRNKRGDNKFKLYQVIGYINKTLPSNIRLHGNNLNGKIVIQLTNWLVSRDYQITKNNSEISPTDIIDDKRYAPESLIYKRMN